MPKLADAYAGLQDAVALGNDANSGIDNRLIERMCHRADHSCGGSTRELRVGVKSNDVADTLQGFEDLL